MTYFVQPRAIQFALVSSILANQFSKNFLNSALCVIDYSRSTMDPLSPLESAQSILNRLETMQTFSFPRPAGATSSLIVAPVRVPQGPVPIRPTTPYPNMNGCGVMETTSPAPNFVTPLLPASKRTKRGITEDSIILTGPSSTGKLLYDSNLVRVATKKFCYCRFYSQYQKWIEM